MIEIRQTETYNKWFKSLKDRNARMRINIRIRRVSLGNFGDVKPVGGGISEIRVDYEPGYRIYFIQRRNQMLLLLTGGNKTTQAKDILKAKNINDPSLVAAALGDIARAKGMAQIAKKTGLGRESLYKALSPGGNPEFATILKVVKALGLQLHAASIKLKPTG